VELAAEIGRAQPSRLIMAAISAVFTIGYVATLLGEDENWIFDLSISMCPEDGCLWVHGVGENGVPAFTRDGIENLRQIIADERAAGRGPPTKPPKWPTLRRSPNAYSYDSRPYDSDARSNPERWGVRVVDRTISARPRSCLSRGSRTGLPCPASGILE
jgi:hypothetical protein